MNVYLKAVFAWGPFIRTMVEATVYFGARNNVIPFSEKSIEKLFQDSYELHFFQAFTGINMKI